MAESATKPPQVDWHSLHAHQVLGAPPGWRWCSIKTLGTTRQLAEGKATHFEVRGAVPGMYARGPRKGRPKWPADKDLDSFIVAFDDFRAWLNQQNTTTTGGHQ